MRAVRATTGAVEVCDVEAPAPGAGREIIRVGRSGICGSDLHMITEGLTAVTLGHEFGGRTDDGRLVAVRPTGACGTCLQCARGRINLCDSAFGAFHGGLIDGGWAQFVSVDSSTVFAVPSNVTPGGAALVEPIAVAVHGVRRVSLDSGQKVAVVGGGSVGLAAIAVLTHLGFEVHVEARYDHQRSAAEALGAGIGLSGLYDIVVDAVGTQSAVDRSVRSCRSGGSIIELGVFWDPVTIGRDMTLREISLIPALFYAHDHSDSDFEVAIDIVAARPDLETILVTHVFPLEDAAEAVRVAGDRSSGAIKVQLAVDD